MDVHCCAQIGCKRFGDHTRSQVGSADADVDHIRNTLAGMAGPLAVMHCGDQFFHFCQSFRHRLLFWSVGCSGMSQSRMQRGPIFGAVDMIAFQQSLDGAAEVRLPGDFEQKLQRFASDMIFRVIQFQSGGGDAEACAAIVVFVE